MKRFCRLFIFLIVLSGWIPNIAAAEVVKMPDASLAAVVRAELDLAPNARITRQALQRLTFLHAPSWDNRIKQLTGGAPIKDLTGLEHATELFILSLDFHEISDLAPLKGLTRLTSLYLAGTEISDLGPLAGLTQLQTLVLHYLKNPINDFKPLSGLKQLTDLRVSVRSEALMGNLRRHVDLTQLQDLFVDGDGNQIGDISFFSTLKQLKYLRLHRTQLRDITPLRNLTQLEDLWLDDNQIRDLKPLADLTQLRWLVLPGNRISDVTPLANLTQLDGLFLRINQISDVKPLAGLTQLERLGLNNNQISDVKPLADLTQLTYLDLRNNQIRDVTPIQHLIDSPSTRVLLEGNPIGGGSALVIETFQANHIKSMKEIRLTGPGPGTEVSSILPGQKFDLYATIKNQSTEKSEATTLKFYRSNDTLLKAFPIKALPADGTAEISFRVTAPKTTRIYYYRACIESVDNKEKTDSNCTAAVEITVGNMKPDLVVHVVKSEDTTYKHIFENTADIYANVDLSKTETDSKPSFKFRVIVKNEGDRTSASTELQLYYASHEDVSEKGKPLKAYQIKKIPSLKPNQVSKQTWTINVPSGGYHYYGAKVEGGKYESDSGNNWSVPVKVHAVVGDLELPENLISDVALTPNATYFVVNAQFPKLLVKNQNRATYGSCLITLGIPGVPDAPLDKWDPKHSWIKGDPPYFMFPLLSAQQRIDALEGKYDLDIKDIVIGAVTTVVGGVVANKVPHVLPLKKVAQHTDEVAAHIPKSLRIGSKFKIVIPAEKVQDGLAKGVHYVIGKAIVAREKFIVATGLRTVLIGGNEEEPSIEDELLAFTADPTLILTPTSGQKTRPQGEARYLFRIPKQQKQQLTEIAVTVEQVYFVGDKAYTAKYQGIYSLEGATAAPALHPMSLSDYPPFQWLSSEAQAYLLRDFGMFVSAETWQVPETTALLPNYPNPFNPETWIPYQLAKPSDVSLTIHDINGRVVRTLDLGHRRAGIYRSRGGAAYWDGKNEFGEPVASGVYFYTLTAGDFSATRKMLIRK